MNCGTMIGRKIHRLMNREVLETDRFRRSYSTAGKQGLRNSKTLFTASGYAGD
jgi:hypothetical protein